METRRLEGWGKAGMTIVCALTLLVGFITATMAVGALDCVENDQCVTRSDANQGFGIGLGVATILFVAGGFAIAACSRDSKTRRNVGISLILSGIGAIGWLYWLLLIFTAGIRATT